MVEGHESRSPYLRAADVLAVCYFVSDWGLWVMAHGLWVMGYTGDRNPQSLKLEARSSILLLLPIHNLAGAQL